MQKRVGGRSYTMVSVEMTDWNGELSPWEFQEPEGRMAYAGRGGDLLADLEQKMIPNICERFGVAQNVSRFVIAGYSLAGLFGVWTMYQTGLFQSAVSCSGSLWYPGFLQYALEHELQQECSLYLSLGEKEERTRNPYMAQVGKATRRLYQNYQTDPRVRSTILEWNVGNHFQQVEERLSKGMAWMLNQEVHCE